MLKLGNNTISNLILGSTQVGKAYLGTNLVWKKTTVLPYLDFNVNGENGDSRYFNTGVVPTENTTVEWCFGIVDHPALNVGFQCGVRTGWITNALMVNFTPSGVGNELWFMWNSNDNIESAGTTWQTTDPYVILRQEAGGKTYVNGTLVYDFEVNLESPQYPIYIGDVNESGEAKGQTDNQGSGRLFWVKIYENGTITHHYIPEFYGGEAGLYDSITNNHLQSTTDFTFGADSIRYGELQT